jgi:hypothetical protein
MRGAQPDAECARCGAVYPPTFEGGLVTCNKCGLVFAPHEVLRRTRHDAQLAVRPASDDLAYPIIEHLGGGVTLETTAAGLSVRSRPWVLPSLMMLGFASVTVTLSPLVPVSAAIVALALLARRSVLTIEGNEVDLHPQPSFRFNRSRFPLTRIAGFSLVPSPAHEARPLFDIVAEVEDGNRLRLVSALRQRTAELIQLRLAGVLMSAKSARKSP